MTTSGAGRPRGRWLRGTSTTRATTPPRFQVRRRLYGISTSHTDTFATLSNVVNPPSSPLSLVAGHNDPLRAHLWKHSYKLFKQLPAEEVEIDGAKALKSVLHGLHRATVHYINSIRDMSAKRNNQVWQRPLVMYAALNDVQTTYWHLFESEACLMALKCHANLTRPGRAEELLQHVKGKKGREEAEEALAEARGRKGEWKEVINYVRDRGEIS